MVSQKELQIRSILPAKPSVFGQLKLRMVCAFDRPKGAKPVRWRSLPRAWLSSAFAVFTGVWEAFGAGSVLVGCHFCAAFS